MIVAIYPNPDALWYWRKDRSWFWKLIREGKLRCAFGIHAPPYSPEVEDESCPRCGDGHAWRYYNP